MDAIGPYEPHPWEKKENPHAYGIMKEYGENSRPSQHTLGIVGGNNAPYETRERQINIESDLRGITRANTFCPTRQHLPKDGKVSVVKRDTPKQTVSIPVDIKALPYSQMWAYPATLAPEPFVIDTCVQPEKY
jgi:hypothetical protein